MDASHISMGRLLAYLFEVTERFGMQTRTELILLQRSMVVVEGVARTLDPRMNIWEAAKPVVERYVRESLGPVALAKDLARTVRILAHFSPRLPELARSTLTGAALPVPPWWRIRTFAAAFYMAAGAALAVLIMLAAGAT
jgi:ubiquinone biosynthesis protein